jgi:hypothetical protein
VIEHISPNQLEREVDVADAQREHDAPSGCRRSCR